jgi:very-short-patch-repair endonuclease
MLAAAGLGIAFNAKPVVRRPPTPRCPSPTSTPILFLLGIRRDEVEAAEGDDPAGNRPPSPGGCGGTPGAVLSHQTAAEIHGFRPIERDSVIVTVHSRTTHVFPGVTVHRTRDLASTDVMVRDSLPVTTRARTIVDLAAVVGRRQLETLLDAAILDRQVGYEAIVEVAERVCRRGKRGSAVLRGLLDQRGHGLVRSATALERLGLKALGLTRLGRWLVQYPVPWVPERRFDAAFPDARVAVEWDSRRWHTAVDDFRSDRERDRAAILHGWVVLRFTWHELEQDPWAVALEIDRVLEAREPD